MIGNFLLCGFGYLACSSISKGAKEIGDSLASIQESTNKISEAFENGEIIIRIETTIYDPDPEKVSVEEVPEVKTFGRPDLRIVS